MTEETFRPRRPQQPQEAEGMDENEGMVRMQMAEKMRQMASQQHSEDEEATQRGPAEEGPRNVGGNFAVKGQMHPAFMQALNAQKMERGEEVGPKMGFGKMGGKKQKKLQNQEVSAVSSADSGHLKELLASLKTSTTIYEEIQLPSGGKFYEEGKGPTSGVISIRPMTGEEEQILATPRFVRKGQAINMIFQRCMKEPFKAENLLTVDRTHMLIYLRGISYSPKYEVQVKCPDCEKKFDTTINLDELWVENCPDDYGPLLQDVMPTTNLPFQYRLSTGRDEQEITEYRDRRIKVAGDAAVDDTLSYRTAMLLDNIDGIDNKAELKILLKNLPINDLSHIRNCINDPPFGVDTNIEIVCPSCLHDFEVDLPLEANFFFPRRKKAKTQA